MSADFIALGLHPGCAAFNNATNPLMCGQDIDVPVTKQIHMYVTRVITLVKINK